MGRGAGLGSGLGEPNVQGQVEEVEMAKETQEARDVNNGCGGEEGMNWEIGIDIYTLLCIK